LRAKIEVNSSLEPEEEEVELGKGGISSCASEVKNQIVKCWLIIY